MAILIALSAGTNGSCLTYVVSREGHFTAGLDGDPVALEPADAQVLHQDPGAGLPYVSSEGDPVHRAATRVAVVGIVTELDLHDGR